MRRPYGIVTAAAVLGAVALAAWWIGPDADRDARTLGIPTPALAQEETGGGSPTPAQTPPRGLTAEQAIAAHDGATRGPRQPIPFSHRFHVSELEIDCMYCHTGTERSSMGIVPSLEVCMGCHRVAGTGLEPIEELRGYWSRNESVRWEWVNKLPDFVQFSHRAHLRNEIACERCHGPVAEMDRVYQSASFTMGWCLDCHRSDPETTDVATDYRLVRENPPPTAPEGRQEGSMYPVAIDQKYGDFRAPIDCLTCHY